MCHTENQCQIDFLRSCGVEPDVFDGIADVANKRVVSTKPYPRHKLPAEYAIKEKQGHGGRPKGSKNLQPKKKSAEPDQGDKEQKPKRRSGRPKGAKNKKTIEKEQMAVQEKRKPGRPKGARNKSKPSEPVAKRKRG